MFKSIAKIAAHLVNAEVQDPIEDIFGAPMIGLSTAMASENAHGVVCVAGTKDKRDQFIKFHCDKPHKLVSPSRDVVVHLFDQVRAMGYHPKSIQISVTPDPLFFRSN